MRSYWEILESYHETTAIYSNELVMGVGKGGRGGPWLPPEFSHTSLKAPKFQKFSHF